MSRASTPAYGVRRPALNLAVGPSTSGTAGVSRAGTPLLSRNTISLEEWESRSPLSDEQLQSIALVREKLAERPLPERFTKGESSNSALLTSRSATPLPSSPIAPRPRQLTSLIASPFRSPRSSQPPSTPGSPGPSQLQADPLRPTLVATPQQFHDHFTALTFSTEHEQDSLYRDHLAEIVALREKCDSLIRLLTEGEGEVRDMLKALAYVEERSESLRGACEDLLEEQTHLLTHTSQLAHRLTFFTFLETAQRTLNNPSHNLVLSEDFLPMVKRLDECLGYLGGHRDFKDSELYLIRYQQCMTRSMTLIRIYFVNAVKALGQEVGRRVADQSLSETATLALLYTKFLSQASSLQALVAELEHRVSTNPEELTSLLSECHSAWVTARQSLIGPRVAEEVGRLNPLGSNVVDLTRAGCGYLKQVCLDEFNLHKSIFLSGESQLYGFLEGLCDYLYDHLRPRILHEPSLEVLCSVCTILQALMVQDVAFEPDDEGTAYTPGSTPGRSPFNGVQMDYFSLSASGGRDGPPISIRDSEVLSRQNSDSILTATTKQRKSRRPLTRLHLEVLLKMVLQDAQTRLVFRAQALLRADVEYYAPKEGDLDYPERLSTEAKGQKLVPREISVSLDEEDDDEPAFLSLPPASAQENWYPSLRVTLWVLSCLYTYVEASVFEDLAEEAVMTCRRSLSNAADLLSAKKDKSTDAKLFLVRHLLILKEMTAGLELNKRDRRKDWQGITDFLRSLLDNASTMLGYARGSIVRSSDIVPDARLDVDRELKRVCEELISQCSLHATSPLRSFLDKCSAYLSTRPPTATPSDLPSQTFATPQRVLEVHDEFKKGVKGEVTLWRERLMLYLQDEDTVRVLVPPALNGIVEAYRQFHDLVRAEYDFSTVAAIMTPSAVHTLLTHNQEEANGKTTNGAM